MIQTKDKEEKIVEISVEKEQKFMTALEEGKELVNKIRRAQRAVTNRAYEHKELMAFYEGKQYELSRYKVSRPWVVRMRTPYASTAIDIRVSSLIADDYRGEIVPMSPEDEDAVRTLKDFIHDEWERLNMDTKIDEAIKASAIVREGYIHVVWNDEKWGSGSTARDGFIETYVIEQPSSIYIDPSALCLKDARYVAVANRKTRDEVKELYPEFKDFYDIGGTGFTAEDRGEVNLTKDYETEQHDVVTIFTIYERKKKSIVKSVVVENILVSQDELDGITVFPIAQMRWKRASASPYGLSLMDELIDPQKAVNAIESAITNTAVAYSAPSYAVRKGSGIDPKHVAVSSGTPGLVFHVEGDIDKAIKTIDVPSLDRSIIDVKADFISVIDRVAGITNPYLGSIGTSGNTAQGSKLALERARIIEADVLGNIERFVEDLTVILVQYVSAGYSGETITSRKIDKINNKVEFNKHKLPKNLEELQYSFFITLSKKTSYSKEREKEMVMEMYQMQHQYKDEIKLINQLDILEAYDMPNKDLLIKRYKQLMQRTNEQKAQMITEMTTQAIQLGIPPEEIAKAVGELMGNSDETPITDALMQQMAQMAQQGAMKREVAMQDFTQGVSEAGVDPAMIQQMMSQMQGQ